jgi:hypothetical protein
VCQLAGFFPRCEAAGDGDLGDSCSFSSDCLAGLACVLDPANGMQRCNAPPRPSDETGELPPSPPVWTGVTCPGEAETPTAYFEVPRDPETDGDFFRLPYPNDIRRTEAGLDLTGHPAPGTAVPVDVIGRYVEAAESDLSGFGTNPVAYFRFSTRHDFASVPGNFAIVNVDPDSDGFGQTHGSVGWLNTFGSISKYICPNWVGIRPAHGAPLDPGTTYAVYLTTEVVPAEADAFARDDDFVAMLASAAPADEALTGAWEAYAPFRTWLDDSGTDPASILSAAVFTTQEPEAMVPKLRSAIRESAVPEAHDLTVCDDGVVSPCDDGTEVRSCGAASDRYTEIHGRITLPIFQAGTAPYETPEDGGGIELDASGAPQVARTEDVCFALTIPKGTPMPETGWPLLTYLHGTGGSFRGAVRSGMAEDAATGSAGDTPVAAATLAIDLPQHGERKAGSERSPEVLFFNFANPRAARDNVLQGTADLMSLVYFAERFTSAAAESPTGADIAFDPARLTVYAHSQGATHASLALPYEPGIFAVLLSGNGGDLTQSLLHKTQPVDIAGLLPLALLEPNEDGGLVTGDYHPALSLFQTYFERADPVNFARRLHREPVEGDPGRHVFMTYGLGDTFSPEPTMQAYAMAARLTMVEPVLTTNDAGEPRTFGLPTAMAPLTDNRVIGEESYTLGLRQYDPMGEVDGHFVATRIEAGRADTLRFLRHALAGLTPPIGE